jgi:hypothetical protein
MITIWSTRRNRDILAECRFQRAEARTHPRLAGLAIDRLKRLQMTLAIIRRNRAELRQEVSP